MRDLLGEPGEAIDGSDFLEEEEEEEAFRAGLEAMA